MLCRNRVLRSGGTDIHVRVLLCLSWGGSEPFNAFDRTEFFASDLSL